MSVLLGAIGTGLHLMISAYMWVIIITVLLSWVRPDPYNPIVQVLNRLSAPLLMWAREKMPFLVINGIDISPIAVIIGLQVFDKVIVHTLGVL